MTERRQYSTECSAGASAEVRGARVVELEGRALLALSENLPKDFSAAVELILATRGRVIVSGIGKSGHIGRKIAATLASTGTPAFFVHAAEASHGDLGMVTADDVCLILSNSGETVELRNVIEHCVRFTVPIIGISKNDESTLMQASRLRLTLPDLPEACSLGVAPTTSTTLAIAVGDALAIALMEQRRFKLEHFRAYHPGGHLGAHLATVAQLMHTGNELPLVGLKTPMTDVILTITSHSFGVAGVVDDASRIIGIISDGDLRRNITRLMESVAADVATRSPIVVREGTFAARALAMMSYHKISSLFVVDDLGIPTGILHLHDCLRAGVV